MPKFLVFLSNGKKVVIEETTPHRVNRKWLHSQEHFSTEASIHKMTLASPSVKVSVLRFDEGKYPDMPTEKSWEGSWVKKGIFWVPNTKFYERFNTKSLGLV